MPKPICLKRNSILLGVLSLEEISLICAFGVALPEGGAADHHPHWSQYVFSSDLYRRHTIPLCIRYHDAFHDFFRQNCRDTLRRGSFHCMNCPHQPVCGWGIMRYYFEACNSPYCSGCKVEIGCLHRNRGRQLAMAIE